MSAVSMESETISSEAAEQIRAPGTPKSGKNPGREQGLVSQSVAYLFALGISGACAVAATSVYTHLLDPDEYGQFALLFSLALLFQAIIFEWARLSVLRFLPRPRAAEESQYKATIRVIYTILTLLVVLLAGAGSLIFLHKHNGPVSCWLVAGFVLAEAWGGFAMALARVQMQPGRFFVYTLLRGSCMLIAGAIFVKIGMGFPGALLGMVCGSATVTLASLLFSIRGGAPEASEEPVAPEHAGFRAALARTIVIYGVPLVLAQSLQTASFVVDRTFIQHFMTMADTGKYAAPVDYVQRLLVFIFMGLNTAAFPMVVRAFEKKGQKFAQKQLSTNITLLLAVSLPLAGAMAFFAPALANFGAKADYRPVFASLLPFIVCTSFLNCIQQYYICHAFHLAKQTWRMILTAGVVLGLNVVIELLLLPKLGLLGVAIAGVSANSIGMVFAFILARRVFPLPVPVGNILRLFASIAIALLFVSLLGRQTTSIRVLGMRGFVMMAIYALAVVCSDVNGIRGRVVRRLLPGFASDEMPGEMPGGTDVPVPVETAPASVSGIAVNG